MRLSSASSWIIFLVSVGIGGLVLAPICLQAPAFAMGEGNCPHQMSYDVSSFQINNGTQTFDIGSNQQPITFDALYSRGYDVNFVVHTHNDPSPNNSTGWRQATNQTFIQYTSDLYNFFNGICAPAKPDSTFTVTYDNVEANSKAISPASPYPYMAGIMSYSNPAIKYTWYVHWIATNATTASQPSSNSTAGTSSGDRGNVTTVTATSTSAASPSRSNATSSNGTSVAATQPAQVNTMRGAASAKSSNATTISSVPPVKVNGTASVATTALATGKLGSLALVNNRLYTLSGSWGVKATSGASELSRDLVANITLTDMENGAKQEFSVRNSAPISSAGSSTVVASASNSLEFSIYSPAIVRPIGETETSSNSNATLYAVAEPGTAFSMFKFQLQGDQAPALATMIYGFVNPNGAGSGVLSWDLD